MKLDIIKQGDFWGRAAVVYGFEGPHPLIAVGWIPPMRREAFGRGSITSAVFLGAADKKDITKNLLMFQKDHHLEQTGIVDEATKKKLVELSGA